MAGAPVQLSPFIGRHRELAKLKRLLAHQHARLITILAPGGMGKTRPALPAAWRKMEPGPAQPGRLEHGLYLVELAPLECAAQPRLPARPPLAHERDAGAHPR